MTGCDGHKPDLTLALYLDGSPARLHLAGNLLDLDGFSNVSTATLVITIDGVQHSTADFLTDGDTNYDVAIDVPREGAAVCVSTLGVDNGQESDLPPFRFNVQVCQTFTAASATTTTTTTSTRPASSTTTSSTTTTMVHGDGDPMSTTAPPPPAGY